jgi:hypothetical protein
MRKILILVVVYVAGGLSGILYHYATSGAANRAQVAALQSDVKARNEKLEKCTAALFEDLRPNAAPNAPSPK